MENLQKNPLKIYIQDIFRTNRTDNKYVFEMFGLPFKNIMIHGVVTSVYNTTKNTTNFELSDPTGCVQIYYNWTRCNAYVSEANMKDLIRSFAAVSRYHDPNVLTMSSLLNSIEKNSKNPLDFVQGSFVSVIGDIFTDSLKGTRMISAYRCQKTSIERDLIWLEELQYLYRKHYLKTQKQAVESK